MRHTATLALLGLFLAPAYGQAPKPASQDAATMCREQNAQVRKSLLGGPRQPDSVVELGTLFNSDEVCTCIGNKLRESGSTRVSDDDAGVEIYFRAHSSCMASHLATAFPAMCPRTYHEILPLMGYAKPTPPQVTSVCTCAEKVLRARLDSKAIFEAMMGAYRYASEYLASNPDKPLDPKQGPVSPFETGMREIQRCAVEELGAPTP